MSRRLPPLASLRAFESAGRHLSFSRAADELHVTQGAISRQIKSLETYLRSKLFLRLTRRVELTSTGASYLAAMSTAFNEIEHATNKTLNPSAQKSLSVSILPSMAILWLMPRLTSFMRTHPDIRINASASLDPVDFENTDVAIRVGKLPGKRYSPEGSQITFKMIENWKGVVAIHLWDDIIQPVCSKRLFEKGHSLKKPQDLRHYHLIHNEARPDCWQAWLHSQGIGNVRTKGDLTFSHSFMAAQAMREHRGIAILPTIEIENLEWKKELAFPFQSRVRSAGEYYLLCSEGKAQSREVKLFTKWLTETAKH